MMTYKNGREVKLHDEVVGRDVMGCAVGGKLSKMSDRTGNGHVIPESENSLVELKNCLHIDDAFPKEPG